MPDGLKTAEQSPIEAEKMKLKNVIATVKEGIIVADLNQNITIINDAAGRLTGYGTTDTVGSRVEDVLKVMEEDRQISVDTFCPSLGVDADAVIYQKDNINIKDHEDELKPVNITSRRIKGGSKIGVGCIIVIEDLFKEADLERTKLDFSAMAGHTLRTPLSELKGYLSFLAKDETKAKLNEMENQFLERCIISTEDIIGLVESLLDLGQVQDSGYEVNLIPMDLDKAIEITVAKFKPNAEEKGIKFVYAPSLENIPLVLGDTTRIKMVLDNLIGNAIKFTNEGSVTITLSKDEEMVTCKIEDTGKGIPQENIDLLFERFYRVKKALDMSMGSGLGLYISKKVIEEHNGKIWIESDVDKGTKAFFSLPISKTTEIPTL